MPEQFEFVQRHDVARNEDFWFEIDEYRRGGDQLLLAHLQFFQWSPSAMKRMLREWTVFRSIVTAPLFATAEHEDSKWVRFVSRLGFKPVSSVICNNGQTRRLFVSRKQ